MKQAEVKRDEHFARELKIKKVYVLIFCLVFIQKMVTLIDYSLYSNECSVWCRVFCFSGIGISLSFVLIYLFSACYFFNYARRYRNFVYKQNRVMYLTQAICILIGTSSSIVLHILIANSKCYMTFESFSTRLLTTVSLVVPSFTISLTLKVEDAFSEFNIYPEQLKRVSVMQYAQHNYNRFPTDCRQPRFSNEKGIFGLGTRLSTSAAEN